ncbi:MAG: GIY-YIG nuclease family protein [Candidatus Binatales bacterium]
MIAADRSYYVYILASLSRTLYIGVTNDLERRVLEHVEELTPGFTSKYHIKRLVYFEEFGDIEAAIAREKQLKGWRREKKTRLIESMNPKWNDLSRDGIA